MKRLIRKTPLHYYKIVFSEQNSYRQFVADARFLLNNPTATNPLKWWLNAKLNEGQSWPEIWHDWCKSRRLSYNKVNGRAYIHSRRTILITEDMGYMHREVEL